MPVYNDRCDKYGKPSVSLSYDEETRKRDTFYCKNRIPSNGNKIPQCRSNPEMRCHTYNRLVAELKISEVNEPVLKEPAKVMPRPLKKVG